MWDLGDLHPWGGLHPRGEICIGGSASGVGGLGRPPVPAYRGGGSAWDTTENSQQAGGTHSTGMHSCLFVQQYIEIGNACAVASPL